MTFRSFKFIISIKIKFQFTSFILRLFN